jgi:hypothetical protein
MDTTTLLTYLFPTQPSPLQVSVSNATANGFLNVVVSAQGQSIYADRINIYLPIGSGSDGFLSSNVPLATSNTTRWTIGTAQQVLPSDLPDRLVERMKRNGNQGIQYVLFNCFPQTTSDQLVNFDLQFSFQITGVDSLPGIYDVGIVESASKTAGGPWSLANAIFTLTKASATFVLGNFTASATSGDVNVPFGAVARNTPFRLSWQSNGNMFTLFTAQNAAPIYQGADTQFTLADGITSTTTFILQAETVGGPQSGSTASGFESIFLYDALTVVCTDADLTTNSIANATTIQSVGDITTQGALSAAGAATVGSLQVNGGTNLSDVSVIDLSGENVNVTNISGDTVNASNLNVTGPFIAQDSTVQLFTTPLLLLSTGNFSGTINFLAETDGLVLGQATVTGTSSTTSFSTFILVHPADPSIPFYQSSAMLTSSITTTSLMAPVRKGDKFGLQLWGVDGNPTANFYFFGLGQGVASNQGLTTL